MARGGSGARPAGRPTARVSIALGAFGVLATAVAAATTASIRSSLEELHRIVPEMEASFGDAEIRLEAATNMLASVQERAELCDWMQEQMRRANPRLAEAEARRYALILLDVTDKYVALDPVFLLSVGLVESHYETRATSHASAKGLYQIHPPTGAWLASELGWTFDEAMLYEPDRNTELAALYLEKLFTTYGDPALVLAEYNGGPLNARRLRAGSDRLAGETRDYVRKVLAKFRRLSTRLDEVGLAGKGAGGAAVPESTVVASLDGA